MYGEANIERLVGKKIRKIFMTGEFLKFETDQGNVVFTVEGDCCSSSYFYDFHGVKKLLDGGPVVSAKSIPMDPVENGNDYDYIQAYGYEIVTDNPQFGHVTSVFSFRNSSNGYYGGSLVDADDNTVVIHEITDDVLEVAD